MEVKLIGANATPAFNRGDLSVRPLPDASLERKRHAGGQAEIRHFLYRAAADDRSTKQEDRKMYRDLAELYAAPSWPAEIVVERISDPELHPEAKKIYQRKLVEHVRKQGSPMIVIA